MENSAALVTGASEGIGKEIARQLAAAGLAVWVGCRDGARGERAVEEIGGDARLLVLDVTDAASIAGAARGRARWTSWSTTRVSPATARQQTETMPAPSAASTKRTSSASSQ
jgi:NAD(P)-dependent dehydrogenase (short-subunit alcohol dehydrogenase family)